MRWSFLREWGEKRCFNTALGWPTSLDVLRRVIVTLKRLENLAIYHSGGNPDVPAHLTEAKQTAYVRCRDDELRIEQERIPQSEVLWRFSILSEAKAIAKVL